MARRVVELGMLSHTCLLSADRSKVRAQEDRTYAGGLRLAVKRSTVFEDSFNKLRSRTPAEMRGKLSVSFIGEEGIDAGGVSREWYQVTSTPAPPT